MRYDEIKGHERVINGLIKAVEKDSVSHFYLFGGEAGLGKKAIAKIFAKTLLCHKGGSIPCEVCSSCRRFESSNHPDYRELTPVKSFIKKAEIDSLIHSMSMAPFESKKKVFIIDEAHQMGKEAQHGILKSLEEPPSYMHLILISSMPFMLLPTIRSRAQEVKFNPVQNNLVQMHLIEKHGTDKERAQFLADFTKGSIGRADELCNDEDFFARRRWTIGLVDLLLKGQGNMVLQGAEAMSQNKENIEDYLGVLLHYFRDLLLYKELSENELIVNKDMYEFLDSHSFLDSERINGIMDKIAKTLGYVQMNVNTQLALEAMLLRLWEE